jgi:hypothetical protein
VSWACRIDLTAAGREITLCGGAGAGGQYASCFDQSDCRQNFACVDTGASSQCLRTCSVTTAAGCASLPGTSCVGFEPAFVISATEYGVCL